MKYRTIYTAMLLPLLASCGADGGKGTASVTMKPGEWEITSKITAAEVLGAPKGLSKEQLQQGLLKEQSPPSKVCLTAEQLAKPSGNFLGLEDKDNCKTGEVVFKDGKLSAGFTCTPAGMSIESRIDGSYEAESFKAVAMATVKDPNGVEIKLKSDVAGKRVGECPAPEKKVSLRLGAEQVDGLAGPW